VIFFFADFMRGEQSFRSKSGNLDSSPALAGAAASGGTDGSQVSDFSKTRAEWIFEDACIEQIAYLSARPPLNNTGKQKNAGCSLQLKSAVRFFFMHSKALHYVSAGPISCQD